LNSRARRSREFVMLRHHPTTIFAPAIGSPRASTMRPLTGSRGKSMSNSRSSPS
jgi:hypothetical protein